MRAQNRIHGPGMAASAAVLVLIAGGCALPNAARPADSTATGVPADRPLSAADLQGALLGSEAAGEGFGPDPGVADEDGARAVFAGDGCVELARWLNAESVPDTHTEAATALSRGPGGGAAAAAEQLYAMDSAHAAAQVVDRYRHAAKRCTEITLSVAGAGDSTSGVRELPWGRVGDASVATGVSAGATGSLADQDVVHVVAHSGTVVVAMTFVGATHDDAERVTQTAVDKVRRLRSG